MHDVFEGVAPLEIKLLLQNRSLRSFSASQMILLIRILPFLVADKVDEDNQYWQCFLLLRKIVDIVLCPISSENILTLLKLYIIDHHKRFVSLYGTSYYTPKMHFLNSLS